MRLDSTDRCIALIHSNSNPDSWACPVRSSTGRRRAAVAHGVRQLAATVEQPRTSTAAARASCRTPYASADPTPQNLYALRTISPTVGAEYAENCMQRGAWSSHNTGSTPLLSAGPRTPTGQFAPNFNNVTSITALEDI